MKNIIVIALGILFISGCSTAPTLPTNAEKDYVVKERNPDPTPDWSNDFSKWKRENDGKGINYYLGESGDVNDRISGCDIASLTAKTKIAQQIAELITNKIAADKQGRLAINPNDSQDPGIKRAFEEQLAGKSIAFLSGVKEHATAWDLRDYSKGNGNKRVFNCAVVVSISDHDLQNAVQKSAQKAPEIVEDAEAKSAVKEALKDIDGAFKSYFSK